MEQNTKTITMPLSEYNQLIQNSNKCFVELYGYTKEEIEELQSSRNASINNTIYWTNRYKDCEEKLSEAKEVIQNLKDTISKIESELSKYKSKKWYEFWK
jgi:chromosome segregation ATPase